MKSFDIVLVRTFNSNALQRLRWASGTTLLVSRTLRRSPIHSYIQVAGPHSVI